MPASEHGGGLPAHHEEVDTAAPTAHIQNGTFYPTDSTDVTPLADTPLENANHLSEITSLFSTKSTFSDSASVRTAVRVGDAFSVEFPNGSSDDGGSISPTTVRHPPPSKNVHGHPDESYFMLRPRFSPPSRPSSQPKSNLSSARTSSSSLHALSGEPTLGRATSVRSAQGKPLNRRISHSKSSSHPINEHPSYPDQSFSALQSQFHPTRPSPFLRTRSSHPSPNLLYTDMAASPTQVRDRPSPPHGARTVGNTPVSSPGLFSPRTSRSTPPSAIPFGDEIARMASPHLHPTHLLKPKETHTVEIEHDTFTGNKYINNYEIRGEIGRGEHGKVKVAHDLENDITVAIKIVPRYSNRRRLGKLGAPEDRVKKEVAILKKARHQNVVSLLEVIDDPTRQKVYIVLEFVEKGEIRWRHRGLKEIVAVNRRRLEREKRGVPETTDTWEQDMYTVLRAQKRRQYMHQVEEKSRNHALIDVKVWSLEMGNSSDNEDDLPEMTRATSRQTNRSNNPSRTGHRDEQEQPQEYPLEGSMYGAYAPTAYRQNRKYSNAASSVSQLSSEVDWDDDDEGDGTSYVPTLTLTEARTAFRDTLLGLEFLHFQGIIHRDIKPANILATIDGHYKISDFGVSYLGRPLGDDEEDKLGETDDKAMDDPRELSRTVGTPAFYAPELCYEDPTQFEGHEKGTGPKITGALDLWSLGVSLYGMIYGRLPFYSANHMGLYTAIAETEPFYPKTRLVPVHVPPEDSKPGQLVDVVQVMNSNKRLENELKVEDVSESVRDLLRLLLIKDPAKRITIENAKKHPWVVEGIDNPNQWIGETDPRRDGKSKIEVNERDLSRAVVKRSLVERALSGVSRIAGNFLGRREGRRRAQSAVISSSASASAESIASASTSSGSTVGKERRPRDTLRGDEVVAAALKASRDGEHPLAQSQTASPVEEIPSYFGDLTLNTKAATTNCTPLLEDERRPRGPDRAISEVSTAESTRTIRASQGHVRPMLLEPVYQEVESPNTSDPGSNGLGGIFSGTGKRLAGMRSRERRPIDRDRSPSADRYAPRLSIDSDGHSGPSLAISRAFASGDFEAPEALRTESPIMDKSGAYPTSSTPPGRRSSYYQPPESSAAAFESAQALNTRRHMQEARNNAEKAASRPPSRATEDFDCPPSPDDMTFLKNIQTAINRDSGQNPMQNLPSASTIASSSIDDFNSGMSESTSHPSIPSVISGASSLSADGFLSPVKGPPTAPFPTFSADALPLFMRTAETITSHGKPVTIPGMALEEQQAADEGDEEGYDSDSDSDEGLSFGGPPKKKKAV